MDFQKEKEAFEAWFESRYDAHFMQFALDLDFYVDKHTQTCWEAWLSSANREGYKLVPVDSLKEIIDCAYCHIYDRCIGDEGDDVIKHILAMGVEDDH